MCEGSLVVEVDVVDDDVVDVVDDFDDVDDVIDVDLLVDVDATRIDRNVLRLRKKYKSEEHEDAYVVRASPTVTSLSIPIVSS
jgi:hypothetical protein